MKHIKTICFVLGGFLTQNGITQVVIPHNIPCLDITPENVDLLESGLHANDCIRADGETIYFNTDQHYSIRAGQYITFNENTVITPDSSHSFHAYIQREDMDLAWYHPNDLAGTIGRYEKLEIGVHFNDSSLNAKINNFVSDQAGDKLNPFNPEEVDLYANFWVLIEGAPPSGEDIWAGPKRVNGFYYEEYNRGIETWDTLENYDNFRIRYAPPVYGMWRCQISAVVAGYDTMHVSDFTFECVGSPNKGFVNVGENKRYLKVGNEPYFPVGQNLTGPNRTSLNVEWDSVPAKPELYTLFHSTMTELADNGANYFRYIVSPWQTEIEFEHLGNYSNRMTNAWEFDRILDTAKSLDLKLHYNMAMHYSFESPNGFAMTNWDWSAKGDSLTNDSGPNSICWLDSDVGYCYRNELDMPEVLDFLTDSTAMAFYKKRLRYMIARWGYSTEIAVMELLSEANNFGNTSIVELVPAEGGCKGGQPDPYAKTRNVYEDSPELIAENLSDWQIEMCRYIKQDLGHTEHPLAVDYTGTPFGDLPAPDFWAGDHTFVSAYVDITNFNHYALGVDKAEVNYGYVKAHRDFFEVFDIDKPIMNPEYGTNAKTWKCDHNSGFIHRVCLTPFTGTAGSAMTWDSHFNEQDSWQYLGHVKDFMEGVPLDADNWTAQKPLVMDDFSIEILYLRSSAEKADSKMMGAISNRTFNYWTFKDPIDGCIDGENLPSPSIYLLPVNYTSSDLDSEMEFKDLGTNNDFKVDFYNALTGLFVGTTYQSSNVFGKLILNFPGSLTGDSLSPILFFKFYPSDDTFLAPIIPDDIVNSVPLEFTPNTDLPPIEPTPWKNAVDKAKTELVISPNPTTGIIACTMRGNFDGMSWLLNSADGQQLAIDKINTANFTLDLSNYSNGIYYVSVQNSDRERIQTLKLIKQ